MVSMLKSIEALGFKLKHRKPKNLKLYGLTDRGVIQCGKSFLGGYVSIKRESGILDK